MIQRPIYSPIRSAISGVLDRRDTALTISQLLPSSLGRVAAIYTDPARPSYDECIAKNMDAIAAGRPQDCVLFSDAAGTVPVTYPIGAGKGKGLLLDRSAGLVRGVEKVVNGGFSTDTDWTKGTGWSISGGVATKVAGTASNLTPAVALVPTVSKVYEVVYTLTLTAGTATISFGAGAGSAKSASGTYTEKLLASTTGNLTVAADASFAGTIDNISVRELPGHHQQQPTAAARGEFSRRYNLLTNSAFTGGGAVPTGWTRPTATGTSVPGSVLSSGSVSYIQAGTTGDRPYLQNSVTTNVLIGETHTVRLRVLAITGPVAANSIIGTAGTSAPSSTFKLNGVPILGSNYVAETGILEAVFVATADGTMLIRVGPGASTGVPGTFSVEFAEPDHRLTADAIPSIPAYQRITTASDYDETNFPTYWRAVTDDWAKSHMNPAGATKAYVFWAGQKMSDAAIGTLLESSATSASNDGTLALVAPDAAAATTYLSRSKGTIAADALATGVAAPSRHVVSTVGDITNDVSSITVNSTTVTSATDQGTGAYLEYDVFFGARAGTSQFANIREYAPPTILFLQPTDSLSASHLAKLQNGYAKAVGVTL